MAIPSSRPDRERDKFVENIDGDTAVRVVDQLGLIEMPPLTDSITVNYPSGAVEVFEYRSGGIAGTILKTITLTYTNASKSDLLNVVVT